MPVSDTLIELLSFSKDELERLSKALRKPVPRGDKFDVASALADEISMGELREAAGEHLGAGRASLSWVVLHKSADGEKDEDLVTTADTPLTGHPVTLKEVEKALQTVTKKDKPFTARLRPAQVTTDPVLVNAQHDGDDLVFLTMAYERTHRVVVRNFEVTRQPEDAFFHVVLRLSRGVLEVRAEARLAGKVTKGWIHSFAEALGRREQRLFLTDKDVDDLQQTLNARMDRHEARRDDEDAGYERQTVTAGRVIGDLKKYDKFEEDFDGSEPVASDLVFAFTTSKGEDLQVKIRVSPQAGTVRCVNHVSNDVMEHVFDTLRQVRAKRVKALATRPDPKS